jgi:phage regulator Rha-like protein
MKVFKELAILNTKIEWMSSKEIAELTGKQHFHVLRDCEKLIKEYKEIYAGENLHPTLDSLYLSTTYKDSQNVDRPLILLSKLATIDLTSGYSVKLRHTINKRWQELEDHLQNLKFFKDDKRKQLEAMEALHDLLPEDIREEKINYIKANTIVNKATSNAFSFPKMLRKEEMNPDILHVREKVMNDYLGLFEIIEDNSKVKDILYDKWQPRRLEMK